MTRIIAVTSDKGGVGKSTLAFNLAGALASHGTVALVDEDVRIHSCLDWAAVNPAAIPFPVMSPAEAGTLPELDYLVIDTEGRPSLDDMVDLTHSVQVVLIPCGTSGMEVKSSIALWGSLKAAGGEMQKTYVVVTKAPPVGAVGQQARDAMRGIGINVAQSVIRAYAAHQRAAEVGVLVRDVQDDRAMLAWHDVVELAEEVNA